MEKENTIVNGNQIYDALMKITEDVKKIKKDKGLDFRFLDKCDSTTEDEKKIALERIEVLERKLNEYGIVVEFYEDIDIKDVSTGCKYYFRIYDENNCFIEIDALEYRKVVIDSSKSEIDYIIEKLFKILGLKVQAKVAEIGHLVTELISYVYYFSEWQYKVYENIGWDIYGNELIFKYDRIYKKYEEEIRSACISDIAGKLVNEYSEEIKDKWRDKFAQLMNSSTVARIVISAACTGLIRSIMPYNKETNINMNIVGEPGSGKSSLCQFALSIFGNPQALEGSFIDKENAMEVIRVKRPIIPYILDDRLLKLDTLSDKAKGHELLFDIFREYEGKVTERVGGTYKGLSGKRTNAPIISSSVESMLQVLMESGKDLGQYRRFIELELKRTEIFGGDSRVVEEYHNLSYQNYGIGVQYIVNYILNKGLKFVNELYNCIVEDITEKLDRKSQEVKKGGLSSSASRFALIATTYVIIREAINTVNSENEKIVEYVGYNYWNDAMEIINSMDMEKIKEATADEKAMVTGIYEYIEKIAKYSQHNSVKDYIAPKVDEGYDELVDYLIDNLLQKMGKVSTSINLDENIKSFLNKKSNEKWFITTNKTDFFDQYASTHIGFMEKFEDSIKITFKGDKYIEWLFCSGKELSDEQIEGYLKKVSEKRSVKSYAEQLFGAEIICRDIVKEIEKIPCLQFTKENRTKSNHNTVSITLNL